MKQSRFFILLVCLSAFLVFTAKPGWSEEIESPQADGSEKVIELTLESCIKIAISSSTAVLKARNDVELGATQVLQAYGQYLPTLSASVSVGAQDGRYYSYAVTPVRVDTRNYGGVLQLSSALNIFNGFADSAGLRSALDKKSSASASLDWARQQIALDVAQAFFQAAYDQRLLTISQENLKVSKARQELLEAQAKVGLKDMADLLRQRALTSRDDSTVSKVLAAQKSDTLALLKRLRLDARRQYRLVEPQFAKMIADESLASENDLIKSALQNRADLKANEYNLSALKSDLKGANAGFLPKLDLGFSVADMARTLTSHSVNEVSTLPANPPSLGNQFGSQFLYSVGLTLTWNIFDRSIAQSNVERAKVALMNKENDSADLRNDIVIQVRRAYADFLSARNQLKANQDGHEAARQAYQAIKGRYEAGAAKFIDLADAQSTLVEAESAEAHSTYQVELQRRTLETAIGGKKFLIGP